VGRVAPAGRCAVVVLNGPLLKTSRFIVLQAKSVSYTEVKYDTMKAAGIIVYASSTKQNTDSETLSVM
jgi:hypothetical protein